MAARGAALSLVYSPSAQRKIAADQERFRSTYCSLPRDGAQLHELNVTLSLASSLPPRSAERVGALFRLSEAGCAQAALELGDIHPELCEYWRWVADHSTNYSLYHAAFAAYQLALRFLHNATLSPGTLKYVLLVLRFAADQGQPDAAYMLADILHSNVGRDAFADIRDLLQYAADVGQPDACVDLLTCEPRLYETCLSWACGVLQQTSEEMTKEVRARLAYFQRLRKNAEVADVVTEAFSVPLSQVRWNVQAQQLESNVRGVSIAPEAVPLPSAAVRSPRGEPNKLTFLVTQRAATQLRVASDAVLVDGANAVPPPPRPAFPRLAVVYLTPKEVHDDADAAALMHATPATTTIPASRLSSGSSGNANSLPVMVNNPASPMSSDGETSKFGGLRTSEPRAPSLRLPVVYVQPKVEDNHDQFNRIAAQSQPPNQEVASEIIAVNPPKSNKSPRQPVWLPVAASTPPPPSAASQTGQTGTHVHEAEAAHAALGVPVSPEARRLLSADFVPFVPIDPEKELRNAEASRRLAEFLARAIPNFTAKPVVEFTPPGVPSQPVVTDLALFVKCYLMNHFKTAEDFHAYIETNPAVCSVCGSEDRTRPWTRGRAKELLCRRCTFRVLPNERIHQSATYGVVEAAYPALAMTTQTPHLIVSPFMLPYAECKTIRAEAAHEWGVPYAGFVAFGSFVPHNVDLSFVLLELLCTSCFYGRMSADEAAAELANKPGYFLIRFSSTDSNYAISACKRDGRVRHVRVELQPNRREFRVVVELQRAVSIYALQGEAAPAAKSAPPPATASKGEYGLGSSLTRGSSANDPEESALSERLFPSLREAIAACRRPLKLRTPSNQSPLFYTVLPVCNMLPQALSFRRQYGDLLGEGIDSPPP